MTPADKKVAHCTTCEFYYDKIDAKSSPLGWCRNGYGRAIHTLTMCPKLAARLAAKKEKLENTPFKPKSVKPVSLPKKAPKSKTGKPKKVLTKNKPEVIISVKTKKIMETEK